MTEDKNLSSEKVEKLKLAAQKAFNRLKIVADAGDAEAQYDIGCFYEDQGEIEKAFYYYLSAAEQNVSSAIYDLGRLVAENKPLQEKLQISFKDFVKESNHG